MTKTTKMAAMVVLLAAVAVAHAANYERIIAQAYREILSREPDSSGLAHYNAEMNAGMTEAALREALLRSAEYAQRFPDPDPPPPAANSATRSILPSRTAWQSCKNAIETTELATISAVPCKGALNSPRPATSTRMTTARPKSHSAAA